MKVDEKNFFLEKRRASAIKIIQNFKAEVAQQRKKFLPKEMDRYFESRAFRHRCIKALCSQEDLPDGYKADKDGYLDSWPIEKGSGDGRFVGRLSDEEACHATMLLRKEILHGLKRGPDEEQPVKIVQLGHNGYDPGCFYCTPDRVEEWVKALELRKNTRTLRNEASLSLLDLRIWQEISF